MFLMSLFLGVGQDIRKMKINKKDTVRYMFD